MANKAADDDSVHICTQTSEILEPMHRAVHGSASEREFLKRTSVFEGASKTFTASSPDTQLMKTVEIGREIGRNGRLIWRAGHGASVALAAKLQGLPCP